MNIDELVNKVHCMDALELLARLPDNSINCIVTSPPYFGLRDYGVSGQIGLERTPAEYVQTLVTLFREARRVLRDDGVMWLNLGDSFAADRGGTSMPAQTVAGGVSGKGDEAAHRGMGSGYQSHRNAKAIGYQHKDLMLIPARVAIALQDDGWICRMDVIWHKPNPMPESVTDRPTKAHEYVFMFVKSGKYWYDAEAIKEQTEAIQGQRPFGGAGNGKQNKDRRDYIYQGDDGYRNKRSVWTVPTQPYSGAHFATFPPALIEPMILAGCPRGGIVYDPFMGSGTTALVARSLGRQYIGSELNAEYVAMANKRLSVPYQERDGLFALLEATS